MHAGIQTVHAGIIQILHARIKITDVSGALVNDLQATGGQAKWNGTKIDGSSVASGVYLIYATDDLGEITAQGKVLIVR